MPYEKVGKNDPVCIADEVPFEIPDSWEWVRLGSVISIFGRIGFRGYTKNDMVDKGKGAITISPSNIRGMDTVFTDNSYISWAKYEESPEIMIFEDDLLLVKTGSSYGKCGIVKNLPEKATINPQLVVLKYVLIDKMYLLYALNSPLARKQYEEFVIGTSIPTFSQEKLASLLIPLPPLEEQERIMRKIQELNTFVIKYDYTEKSLNDLQSSFPETLKKSILQQAVMGKLVPQDPNDEPASVLLEHIRAEKQELIKAGKLKKDKHESIIYRRDNSHYEKVDDQELCIDDEIPFEIPDNWAWIRASSLGSMIRGKGIKRTETVKDGFPCVRYGEIYTSYSISFTNAISYIDEPLDKSCLHFDTGDIIFTLTGENKVDIAKAVAYLGDAPVAAGGDLAYWTAHGMNPLYIVFYMASPYCIEQKRRTATGDIIVHISTDKVGHFLVPVPPITEQKRIVESVLESFSKISAL